MRLNLTKEQKAILKHHNSVGLVVAGAGTGKTTTLLEYVMHQIRNEGADPADFLLLSFSKTAAEELRARLLQNRMKHGVALLELDQVKVMTYDALGYEIVRAHYKTLGFDKVPTVVTKTKNLRRCIAKITQSHGADKKDLAKDVIKKYQGLVLENGNPLADKVLCLHAKFKQRTNTLDFKDMTSLLQGNNSNLVTQSAESYKYLLVDELQDTNGLQVQMLLAMARAIPTVLMVGDPKQNIYEFRGAYVSNWALMQESLIPKVYTLTRTQRIPAQSLPFINALGNEIHPGADLISDINGQPTQYISYQDFGDSQADFIAKEVRKLIKSGLAKDHEIACLGRTRRLLSDLAIGLEHQGIPVKESYKPDTQNHLVGLRNLLRLTRTLRDHQLGRELLLTDQQIQSLQRWLKRLGAKTNELELIFNRLPKKGWKAVSVRSRVNNKQPPHYKRILDFRNAIIQASKSNEPEKAILYLMDAIRKVLYRKYKGIDLHLLMRDLSEIKVLARQFKHVSSIRLNKLHLNKASSGVHLGTINNAKGKEWKYVFVINCTEGILPIHYAKSEDAILAEKRLLYVASTRHKNGLYLIHSPTSIVVFDGAKKDIKKVEPSSFLMKYFRLDRER
ncbi:MAG: ATP-dependent helicase [Methylobacter sp.]|nr:ATP-dependent helicase [Methylobacter sp.]